MASTPEVALNSEAAAGKAGYGYGARAARSPGFSGLEFALRLLLFASSVSALVVLVTANQTVAIPVFLQPQVPVFVSRAAKFSYSPAFIYLLVALAVASLYSMITVITSAALLSKTSPASSKRLFRLMVLDVLMAGIMASATGSAGSVAYIGVRGNSHVLWNKICNVFGKYCRHVGSATALSLVAAIVLVLLAILSSFTLYRRSKD